MGSRAGNLPKVKAAAPSPCKLRLAPLISNIVLLEEVVELYDRMRCELELFLDSVCFKEATVLVVVVQVANLFMR